jgi:hypothetical protein
MGDRLLGPDLVSIAPKGCLGPALEGGFRSLGANGGGTGRVHANVVGGKIEGRTLGKLANAPCPDDLLQPRYSLERTGGQNHSIC